MTRPAASLRFLGAAGTVTGSRFALDLDGHAVLVDGGLFQGLAELRLRNWAPLPIAASSVSEIVLTHAHIDHSGYLPRLMGQGFRGDVMATNATEDLLRIHHLRRRLSDPRTTVILVGYQAAGTRGRALEDGAEAIRIFGQEVPVRAHVVTVNGLSAHADADGLLRWLETATRKPRRVFVVHGDLPAATALATRVRAELGLEVSVAEDGQTVTLA
jgi:Cft2 family RNA processing exonuclease